MTSPGHQLCIESASKLFTNRIFERITVFQLQFATFFILALLSMCLFSCWSDDFEKAELIFKMVKFFHSHLL